MLRFRYLSCRLVFTAGNADTFSRVLLTLKLLRKYYNTTLPAEIFSFPGEMPPPDLVDEFAEYNATLRVVRCSASHKDSILPSNLVTFILGT